MNIVQINDHANPALQFFVDHAGDSTPNPDAPDAEWTLTRNKNWFRLFEVSSRSSASPADSQFVFGKTAWLPVAGAFGLG